jgi:Cu(I)/Ag(I) efflux system protein CusF
MRLLKTLAPALLFSVLGSTAHADWASGEIRRLDVENKRLTIKHGEIKSLDMPPMTMVFYVTNAEMLNNLKVTDLIEFKVVEEGKRFMVTEIRRHE